MAAKKSAASPAQQGSSRSPTDDYLIAGMLEGDAAALRQLIERYDRLVRFTILRATADRCRQDPLWLESVASATWDGFVRSLQRSPESHPRSARAYLVQIAKNQCVTALRRTPQPTESLGRPEGEEPLDVTVELEEPVETLARLELLEVVQGCLAELDTNDKMLTTQLTAITDRRWKDAAFALGVSESALRSRWKKTLERLRRCIKRKTGESFAPGALESD